MADGLDAADGARPRGEPDPPVRLEITIMRTDVTFPSAGLKLAGHLYTPGDSPETSPGHVLRRSRRPAPRDRRRAIPAAV